MRGKSKKKRRDGLTMSDAIKEEGYSRRRRRVEGLLNNKLPFLTGGAPLIGPSSFVTDSNGVREVPKAPWDDLMAEADRVLLSKGRDYTKGSQDRLANFKNSGSDAGITPLQAWLVFYNKHHSAICSYIKSGGQNESEPIFGRFVDALNYLRLGWALVKEDQLKAEQAKESKEP